MKRILVSAFAVLTTVQPAWGQSRPTGYISIFADHFPNRDASELRARVFAEEKLEPSPRLRVVASGFAEGLVADRGRRVTAGTAEPHELSVEVRLRRIDVTAGLTRAVWGRLDEVQPTDVVNPLDASRFLFDGRADARLAVPMVRGRVFAGDKASIEAIYVPFFRRGRFDRLDEATSPFNLAPATGGVARDEPARTLGNAQGGARLNLTTRQVDWSISAYRGFRPFGVYSARIAQGPPVPVQTFPRFTMIGGDFESVAGAWGVRGEVAAFVEDTFQSPNALAALPGRGFDAGAGFDRKAGEYRVGGSVLLHTERYDTEPAGLARSHGRTDLSLVGSADRRFAREKYEGRLFVVYTPTSTSGFVRGIGTAALRDNVAVEASLGWFAGAGPDTIGRFSESDFAYVRLKYYF